MGKRILIVDDAAFMRMMIKNIVIKNGYEVVGEAENGQVAFELYQELKPDVVTMDITMPEVNGIEGIKKICECDPKAKIIVCSAMGQETMVMEAIGAGAKDFIVKPFQQERILQALERVQARA
ncbi:chemotaxis protein CheY [Peptococcaceae bacterium SCADC1_2_3]|jgi:two-component system chemotaxis response regulator CheY|nr:chemotaxis protein CheY [Peptococcaceae bacterium SCADC1_2_3]KFI34994.1 chemotaxis protein CheY [Peptococcaceae bacterium SCADC1_2_3]KFI35984.1 chemotaxis protein CheY [Peptococcaceae bacterium SCADC1_2_3]